MYLTEGNLALSLNAAKGVLAKPSLVETREEYFRDPVYLTSVCFEWWDWHTEKDSFELLKDGNGKPLVEKNFSFTIFEDDNLIIELCGTIDKVGKFKNGPYGIGDYKTTSKWDIQKYFLPSRLSVQLRTYYYAVMWHAKTYPDSIYAEMLKTPIVVFLDGVFLKSPSERAKGKLTTFERSDAMRITPQQMAEYQILLSRKVQQLVAMFYEWKNDKLIPYREGLMVDACKWCTYQNLCATDDEIIRASILKRDFVKKEYNPLMFGGKE